MIPIRDENPTLRRPVVTIGILVALLLVWLLVQGAGIDEPILASSICTYGLIPGELTTRATVGTSTPIAPGLACVVTAAPHAWTSAFTSMFLHGSWGHLLGNALFLWVFGNNVEDSMTRPRFGAFYLLCGLAAAGLQVAVHPASAIPMVGASGAIAGVLGGYLVLYPRVRVEVLLPLPFLWPIFRVPAYLMLLWWIGLQAVVALPQLSRTTEDPSAGVAVFAHIGGFVAGALLIKLFERRASVARRDELRRMLHPEYA